MSHSVHLPYNLLYSAACPMCLEKPAEGYFVFLAIFIKDNFFPPTFIKLQLKFQCYGCINSREVSA